MSKKRLKFVSLKEILNDSSKFEEYYFEVLEIVEDLPYKFRDCLKYFRKKMGFSRELLEEKSGISSQTIKEIETNDSRGYNLETIIYLCVGMSLPPDFSFELIEKSGFNISSNGNRLNCLYKIILRNLYSSSIEEVKAFINDRNKNVKDKNKK